jgi:hypothetical protein
MLETEGKVTATPSAVKRLREALLRFLCINTHASRVA